MDTSRADTSHIERNHDQQERLRVLGERLSDEALGRPIGDGDWTVAMALAHLAYWDGRTLATLEASVRHGIARAWWDPAEADAVNAARLPGWAATPPREALRAAIRAAEAVDRYVEGLAPELVGELAEERPVALDRARHRGSHLDEIEQALARSG